MAIQIQYRRDDAATWTSVDPILAEGEPGYETDTGKFKVGNGVDNWSTLVYSSGPAGPTGSTGATGQGVPTGGTTGQVLSKIDGTDYNTQWITSGAGTVTSVGGTGTVNGITLTGTVTSSGNLTLGGTLSGIGNSQLTNSAITINGTSTVLGGSINVGTVTGVTATAPVASSGGTAPVISMAKATTSVDGYLSATDWTTFNSKQPAGTYATGTGSASGTNTGDETTATIKTKLGTASTSTEGYLTSTDWNTFNNKANKGANTDITSVTLTSGTITTTPSSSNDIVNKSYADSIVSGVNYHQAVNNATTAALPSNTYNNGTSGVGATLTATANGALTVDGTLQTVGKRVLVKNEATASRNGIYTVTQVGNGSTPYILTRATDYDVSGSGANEIDAGDMVLVLNGTSNANTSWVQQTALPITIGTTDIVFIEFAKVQTYTAGTGLTLATNQFSITNTGTAGTYGSASLIPVITTNAQGQVTGVTTAANPQGTVTNVTGGGVISVATGTTTPAISISQANTSTDGYLTSTDWNTFNSKGNGTVTSVGGTGTVSGLTLTGTVTSTGNLTLGGTLSATASNISDFSTAADARIAAASINALSDVVITTPSNTQVLTYNGTNWVNAAAPSGGGSFTGGTLTSPLIVAAGTSTNGTEPLKFQSGTVVASPAAGTMEYDGNTVFATPAAGNRGVVPAVHYITQTSAYTTPTGTNNTLKQLFNATTNGALTVAGSTTYFFECDFDLTAISATSGSFSFGFLGTATYTRVKYWATAKKAAASQGAALMTTGTAATATALVAANTTTTGQATIRGKIVIGTGGTIIPAIAFSVASPAVVGADSYFKIWAAGSNTEVEIGAWT